MDERLLSDLNSFSIKTLLKYIKIRKLLKYVPNKLAKILTVKFLKREEILIKNLQNILN